jgi:hypothetical protein
MCAAICAPERLAAQQDLLTGHAFVQVEQLIRAAFPELQRERPTVTLSLDHGTAAWSETRSISMLITAEANSGESGQTIPGGGVLLRGRFEFQNYEYATVSFTGRHVNEEAGRTVAAMMRRRTMGVDEITAVLERVGARYGPDKAEMVDDLIASHALVPLLRIVRLNVPEFHFPGDRGGVDFAPHWLVRGEGQALDHRMTCIALWLEPFDGRLIRLRQWTPEPTRSGEWRCSVS